MTRRPLRIAMVSEHASPLAVYADGAGGASSLGGVDAGGQNVHVEALARHLARRGHTVTVYTRRDNPHLPAQVLAPGGFRCVHIDAGPPVPVPKDELLGWMPDLAAGLAIRWARWRPDLAHAHFWMSGLATVEAAGAAGVPTVLTYHALGSVKRRHQGADDTSPATRIAAEARLGRTVDLILATAHDEVRELAAIGVPEERVQVVPCGVDPSHFMPGGDRDRTTTNRILCVGRLVERKGVDDVVRAMPRLPGVELLVAGGPDLSACADDPQFRRLVDLAGAVGVADRVRFLGRVHRHALPALIRSVDLVVCVPWYEPFGIVPLEAMACGTPVVGAAVGGLLDTVLPDVTGVLVPPRDEDALVTAISGLLADPARRARYGRAAVARVRALFSWEQVAAATEGHYRTLLTGVAAAPRARALPVRPLPLAPEVVS